ncbi:hypothetical protein [Breoghania sp. L-A4]|nr:hypothetical protein [Breoghania sp. L-A4]
MLTYTSSQSAPGTSGAELTNRAEVTGQGPETTLINNTVQTVDELEN